MSDFNVWLKETCFQKPTPEAEDLARSAWDERQKVIDNMAMLMRMLLSERGANRTAKKYLIDNDLMGSALRDHEPA